MTEKAQQIEDNSTRTFAYWVIAESLIKTGNLPEATSALNKAKEAASLIKDDMHKTHIHIAIARAQARAKDATAARKTLDIAEDLADRLNDNNWAYNNIAHARVMADDVDKAKKIVTKFDDTKEYHKMRLAFIYRAIATAQAAAGDIDGAMKTAAMIEVKKNDGLEPRVLAEIAQAQAEAGDTPGAMRTAARIKREGDRFDGDRFRDFAYNRIIDAHVEAGNADEIKKIIDLICDDEWREGLRADIAIAQAKRGGVDAAAQTMALLDERGKKWAYSAMAVNLAKAGDVNKARELITLIGDNERKKIGWTSVAEIKAKAYVACACALAKRGGAGNITEAQETADLININRDDDNRRHKATAYTAIAAAQVKADDIPAARQTMNNAKKILSTRDANTEWPNICLHTLKDVVDRGDLATAIDFIIHATDETAITWGDASWNDTSGDALHIWW